MTLPYFPEKSGSAQQLDDNFIDKSFERISTVPGFGSEKNVLRNVHPMIQVLWSALQGCTVSFPKEKRTEKKITFLKPMFTLISTNFINKVQICSNYSVWCLEFLPFWHYRLGMAVWPLPVTRTTRILIFFGRGSL